MISRKIRFKLIFFSVFFAGIFGFIKTSIAESITAVSCSQPNVQAAIDAASDPHPLQGGADTVPPAAPSGFTGRII